MEIADSHASGGATLRWIAGGGGVSDGQVCMPNALALTTFHHLRPHQRAAFNPRRPAALPRRAPAAVTPPRHCRGCLAVCRGPTPSLSRPPHATPPHSPWNRMASPDRHALPGCLGLPWLAATTRHAGRHPRCCHCSRLWLRLPPQAPPPLLAATPPAGAAPAVAAAPVASRRTHRRSEAAMPARVPSAGGRAVGGGWRVAPVGVGVGGPRSSTMGGAAEMVGGWGGGSSGEGRQRRFGKAVFMGRGAADSRVSVVVSERGSVPGGQRRGTGVGGRWPLMIVFQT